MSNPTHLSLFSGIGGLDLAAEWAGFETVGQCEWADYPRKVLERHWTDVPRWRDIHDLTGDDFYERTGRRTVDIISGGFPCQPFSVAGKHKGKGDDRYLWPQMCRVIAELEPRWVVGENVPGILRIAAADVVQDLERLGFECVVFDFEAAAVGAPHRRERVAFVAHRKGLGFEGSRADREQVGGVHAAERKASSSGAVFRVDCEAVANTDGRTMRRDGDNRRNQWSAEPDVGRMAHGIPNRVDRLRCLGNAVVPQQFYPIFRAIRAEIDREGS